MKARTHGARRSQALAAERTLSVTTHCLRQQQTRLLGNAGCFVSIACILGTAPFTPLFQYSPFFFSHTHTLLPLHCIITHYSLFSPSLILADSLHCLLLGVRLPRATPLASLRLQPYLLVPPIVLSRCNIACIPGALPVSTIPTIHYNT